MTERERIEEQIRLHEGESLTPYVDTVGKITIGVGHNLSDRGISSKVSRLMLQEDLDEAITDLATFPWFGTLNAVRQRALIDLRFNLGYARFRTFKQMLKAFEMGDHKRAAMEMLHSKWAAQVGARATKLARMVETGAA